MKKFISILCSVVLACVFLLAGCGGSAPKEKPMLRLRSEKEQTLKVGEEITLVWTTANTEQGVTFSSSDPGVVTVDSYGSVEAVGTGEADVTVTLVEDTTVSEKVHFSVTRNFFMQENGYKNGTIDFANADAGGTIYIKDGQAQLLVERPGQTWFFKCHLKRTGCTNGDTWGRWGVGSFLVNAATPIGEVMFWTGLMSADADANTATSYYGGWRALGNGQDAEVTLSGVIEIGGEADLTIIRYGTRHYFICESDETVVKGSVDVPKFAGRDTYPGVYGQNQILEVSDYEASNISEEVLAVLDTFQEAEEISVNGLDDRLVAGKEYDLTASVLPAITINKNVTWGLETAKEGVALTPEGHLTVGANVRGDVTVRVTAQSGKNVTATRTFNVIEIPASQSQVFETGMLVGDASAVTVEDARVEMRGGKHYLPAKAEGDVWYVSAKITGDASGEGARAGFMSAKAGYMRYFRYGICGDEGSARQAEYGDGYAASFLALNYAANGDAARAFTQENEIGLLKDGETYYFFANGKLISKQTAAFGGSATPVLYAEDCSVQFDEISVITDEAAVRAMLAQHKFYVGGHVTKTGDSYTLASVDFGEANNMNWPPDNDYVNGLKFAEAIKGDYTIEFTMSGVKPYGTTYDAKVLVYLKSERVTSSLQFVFKGNKQFPTVAFCANLDDNSWDEYTLPAGVDLLSGETRVKIVKTAAGAELWLNGTQVTEVTKSGAAVGTDVLLRNNGYWNADTACTPGIGSFKCGVTITNPVVTKS